MLFRSVGFGGAIGEPWGIAIDGSGTVWIAGYEYSTAIELSNAGAVLSPGLGYGSPPYNSGGAVLEGPRGLAIDGSGSVWVASLANSTLTEFVGLATPVVTPICAGLPATPTADGSSRLGTRP